MADDDFYVEDESIEDIRAAIKRGEKGETVGKKDLNQRARSVVDRAVARLGEPDPAPRLVLTIVSSGSNAGDPDGFVDPRFREGTDTSVTHEINSQVG